jgi:hypothetical protein
MSDLDHLNLPSAPAKPTQKWNMPSRYRSAKERKAEADRFEREQDALIDKRDRRQCRACGKHSDPDVMGLLTRGHRAHIVYASAGGTLCGSCHDDEHRDRPRFTREGGPYVGVDANLGMEFWRVDAAGTWYLSRRELAPHVPEKD